MAHRASGGGVFAPASFDPLPDLAEVGLGVRLLALSVVAGAGALLPLGDRARVGLISGILAGALIGWLQHRLLRARRRRAATLLIVAQVALWTALLGVTGGQRSPFFAGYLLEVALGGLIFARGTAWLAAASALAAFVIRAWWLDPPLNLEALAHVAGFTLIGALLTSLIVDLVRRQRARLREYHQALQQRASSLSEELRLLGDYLGSALVVLDDLGRIVSANAACERLLNWPTDAAGRAWQELLVLEPEGSGRVARALDEGGAERDVRVQYREPDGRLVALRMETWTHATAEGRRTYLMFAEAAMGATEEDPLHRLGEAVACVAHQFRNSVHALQHFAGDLRSDRRAGEVDRDRVEGLLGVISSLGELSRDVLAMASPAPSAPEDLAVAEVLRASVSLARAQPVVPQVRFPDTGLHVMASRGPLVHALFNLIDNACRVSPPGEPPLVHADSRENGVGIWIEDRGPGLPEAHPAGRRPDAKAQGTGFGLVAARRFIEASGGALTFSCRPGGGTSCLVWLRGTRERGTHAKHGSGSGSAPGRAG